MRCILSFVQTLVRTAALARFGQALSDQTRTRILLALSEAPQHPSDLADKLGVSRQGVSNHLSCLRGCGLVIAVPHGRRVRYELADARLARAIEDLMDVVLAVDALSCSAAATDGCC